ncbi:MAG: hypothetical protein AAF989_03385 [Planctomycetota bacterium]
MPTNMRWLSDLKPDKLGDATRKIRETTVEHLRQKCNARKLNPTGERIHPVRRLPSRLACTAGRDI